jgi:hypothetical protein
LGHGSRRRRWSDCDCCCHGYWSSLFYCRWKKNVLREVDGVVIVGIVLVVVVEVVVAPVVEVVVVVVAIVVSLPGSHRNSATCSTSTGSILERVGSLRHSSVVCPASSPRSKPSITLELGSFRIKIQMFETKFLWRTTIKSWRNFQKTNCHV